MSTEATVVLMVGLTSPLWVQLSWELFRSIRTRRKRSRHAKCPASAAREEIVNRHMEVESQHDIDGGRHGN
jgi:hypothetical protein